MDIVSNVHNKGGKICLQLCHAGRISHEEIQPNNQPPVAPSAIKAKASTWLKSGSTEVSSPRELQSFEIANIIEDFRQAAFNAKKAGFDMIEIHAANGYLIDQFLRDSTNERSDNYGGSIENRVRFLLEIVDAISSIFPSNKIGCRVSPTSSFNDIYDSNPQNLFDFLAIELGKKGLAYLHAIEGQHGDDNFNFDKLYKLFKENGGLTCMINRHEDKITEVADADLIVFGIPFIANPDFVFRLEHNLPLNEADSSTFYGGNEKGYTDYPFYQQS
jgi:N-ethylmaleimide reductase